jgi:hypothetical protein
MATHSVSIIDHRQLSDGQFALLAECCSDPKSHSWLTCAAEIVVDDRQYQDSITHHCQRVADLHESMQQALAKAKVTIGTRVSVTPSTSSAIQAEDVLKTLVGTSRQIDPPSLSVH